MRFYSSPFSGSATKRAAFWGIWTFSPDCSEWQMKCYKTPVTFAVALPTASRSMGCFQMQQRRLADGFGHLQPMLVHQDWPFAQFPRLIPKANN